MQYYALLIIAVVFSSFQSIFNQKFQKYEGNNVTSALNFAGFSYFTIFIIILFMSGFKIRFNFFALFIALFYGCLNVGHCYFALKAFSKVNLSVFSIFNMLGGMLLPFCAGIIFSNENITLFKLFSCFTIILSIILQFRKGKSFFSGILYCLAVFFCNGICGVLSFIHQSNQSLATDSLSFMASYSLFTAIICFVWLMCKNKKIVLPSRQGLSCSFGYAVCCGTGNLLSLIALKHLPASVQYPFLTGGVIIFSFIISILQKEKVSLKSVVSVLLAFLATLFIVL